MPCLNNILAINKTVIILQYLPLQGMTVFSTAWVQKNVFKCLNVTRSYGDMMAFAYGFSNFRNKIPPVGITDQEGSDFQSVGAAVGSGWKDYHVTWLTVCGL